MWQLKKAKLREKKGCFRLFQKRQIQKPVNKFFTKIEKNILQIAFFKKITSFLQKNTALQLILRWFCKVIIINFNRKLI